MASGAYGGGYGGGYGWNGRVKWHKVYTTVTKHPYGERGVRPDEILAIITNC